MLRSERVPDQKSKSWHRNQRFLSQVVELISNRLAGKNNSKPVLFLPRTRSSIPREGEVTPHSAPAP